MLLHECVTGVAARSPSTRRRSGARGPGEGARALSDQRRAAVDQPGVELHQGGAGGDLGAGIVSAHDAAHADDRIVARQRAAQRADHAVRRLEYRRPGQPSGLVGVRQAGHRVARHGGIGGDHRVDAVAREQPGDRGDLRRRRGRARSSAPAGRVGRAVPPVRRGAPAAPRAVPPGRRRPATGAGSSYSATRCSPSRSWRVRTPARGTTGSRRARARSACRRSCRC